MTRCFGVVPMATSSSRVCPNSCVAFTIFSVLATMSRKNRAARSSSVITGLSLGVRLVLGACDGVASSRTGRARRSLLRIELMAQRANFSPKFGQLSCHLVKILAARYPEHRGSGFADVVLPAAQLQPRLQQFFLRSKKAIAALISDQFLVGDFTPFRKCLAPIRRRLVAIVGDRRHGFHQYFRGV